MPLEKEIASWLKDYLLNIKDPKVPAVYIPWTRFGSSGFDKQPKNVINNSPKSRLEHILIKIFSRKYVAN